MFWLPLAILTSFGFGQCWKISLQRGCHAPTVVTANYVVIGLLLGIYLTSTGNFCLEPGVIGLGAMTGLAFIISMFTMTRVLEKADSGAVLTAFRLSIMVPIAFGVWLWGEEAGFRQWLGIALALTGLVLMTKGGDKKREITGALALVLLLVVFLLQGLCHTSMRSIRYLGLAEFNLQILFFIGITAGILGSLALAVRRHKPRSKDIFMGSAIGAYNLCSLAVVLTALRYIDGTVYYPIHGACVVILDNIFAHFVWKEKITKLVLVGVILGVLSVVLVRV